MKRELFLDHQSAICQKILENGGDILKFAGDAILALWKCERAKLGKLQDHFSPGIHEPKPNGPYLDPDGVVQIHIQSQTTFFQLIASL